MIGIGRFTIRTYYITREVDGNMTNLFFDQDLYGNAGANGVI